MSAYVGSSKNLKDLKDSMAEGHSCSHLDVTESRLDGVGCGVWGVGFGVLGVGCGVWRLGSRI